MGRAKIIFLVAHLPTHHGAPLIRSLLLPHLCNQHKQSSQPGLRLTNKLRHHDGLVLLCSDLRVLVFHCDGRGGNGRRHPPVPLGSRTEQTNSITISHRSTSPGLFLVGGLCRRRTLRGTRTRKWSLQIMLRLSLRGYRLPTHRLSWLHSA